MTHNSHNNEPKSKCCEAERTYVTQKYHSGACSECDKPFVPDYEKECSACGIDHNPNTSKCFDETKRKPIKLHKKCGCELDMECEDCFTDTAKIVTITTPTEGLDWMEKERKAFYQWDKKSPTHIHSIDETITYWLARISTLIEEARKKGIEEGQDDAFNGRIEKMGSITIKETINVPKGIQEIFREQGRQEERDRVIQMVEGMKAPVKNVLYPSDHEKYRNKVINALLTNLRSK